MELSSDSHSPIGSTTAGETESRMHFSLVSSCLFFLSLSLSLSLSVLLGIGLGIWLIVVHPMARG